ncbi:MAG: D-glycerate dehydrogenase [Candidatus Thermoplasmatota archaeon]|nr:D-glycerate dehydrogenase [Candidatus Thermoplasmatota archaeon]
MTSLPVSATKRSWKVLVTRQLPGNCLSDLDGLADLEVWKEDGPIPREMLLEMISDKDALICLVSDKVDREVILSAPRLKAIGNFGVGYDNIDLVTASERGIPVFNTPNVLTEATADLAFALILSAARRLGEAERFLRKGDPWTWSPNLFLGRDVWGASLGVVGAGKIGRAILMRGKGFGMRLFYTDTTRRDDLEDGTGAKFVTLDELLSISDIVSLNVPLSVSTRHLIGERELSLMKEGSILVNTSRGPVLDEAALERALRGGRPAAAGLDVYENEPIVLPGLLKLDNVVLLPHIGSATLSARRAMGRLAAGAIAAFIRGERPMNTVNPNVLGPDKEVGLS